MVAGGVLVGLMTILLSALQASAGTPRGEGNAPLVVDLEAALRGSDLPGRDPDARGHAFVRLNHIKKKICFRFEYRRVATPVTGLIYHRSSGYGPYDLVLFEDSTDPRRAQGCFPLGTPLRREIGNKPTTYYVALDTAEYPRGGVRCQLNYEGEHQSRRCVAPPPEEDHPAVGWTVCPDFSYERRTYLLETKTVSCRFAHERSKRLIDSRGRDVPKGFVCANWGDHYRTGAQCHEKGKRWVRWAYDRID
jgi:hypothetical protein